MGVLESVKERMEKVTGLEASVARRSSSRGQEPQAEFFLFQGRRNSSEQSDTAVYPLPQPGQPRGGF
jgi:hypothetical protein